MIYPKVCIRRSALASIRRESCFVVGTETGGPLVGFVEQSGNLVITHAAGPGPRAELKPNSVLIDGTYAQQYCNRMRKESDGLVDYIGDWHLHRGYSTKPSSDDVQAMKIMAEFEYCPIRTPVSLICSRISTRISIYTFIDGKLKETPLDVVDA